MAALTEDVKKIFLEKYEKTGKEQFYQFILSYATSRLNKGEMQKPTPENELLSYYEKFLALYRKDNNENYIEMAKTFRRAAQKIYKIMLDVGLTTKNTKFLTAVGKE